MLGKIKVDDLCDAFAYSLFHFESAFALEQRAITELLIYYYQKDQKVLGR